MRTSILLLLLLVFSPVGGRADRPDPPVRAEQIVYERLLQEHPRSSKAHAAYAQFLADEGNLRTAVVHWVLAVKLDPDNAAIANALGGTYLRMGHAADAAAEFSRAVALERNNPAYHFDLANVEFMLRRELTAAWQISSAALLQRAMVQFKAATDLAPDNLEYARAYAESFYALADPDWSEAAAAWQRVASLSSDRSFAYLHLARVNLKLGDAAQARAFLDKVTDSRHDALKRKLLAQAAEL